MVTHCQNGNITTNTVTSQEFSGVYNLVNLSTNDNSKAETTLEAGINEKKKKKKNRKKKKAKVKTNVESIAAIVSIIKQE